MSSTALRGCGGPSPTSSVLAAWCNAAKSISGGTSSAICPSRRLHASVGKALRDAWNLDSADRAARVVKRLAGSLEHDHPGAAASIREGLDETLTVQRLGLTGALQRTLRTTNIIENLNGSVEHYSRNVKRWRGGQMIQRWVASALVEAEKHFRRVRGYRDLQHLVGALGRAGSARRRGC